MTNRSLGRAVFRIWGLIWLISAGLALPIVISTVLSWTQDAEMARYVRFNSIASFSIESVGGLLMFLKAGQLSDWAFPLEEPFSIGLDAAAIQAIALSILGLYFVLHAIPGVVGVAQALAQKPKWNQDSTSSYIWQRHRDNLLGPVVQLVAGIAIFVGAAGLSKLWQRLHPLAAPPVPEDEPGEDEE